MAAAVYEVGRPKRFSLEEKEELDAQWRVFGETWPPLRGSAIAKLGSRWKVESESVGSDATW